MAGCATLPPPVERPYEGALTDTGSTSLGRIAAASLAGASPSESGFRLLPSGSFAFDARLALARRAERSLDVQYYQLQADSIGLRFLRELRDAARRGVRVRLLLDDLYTAGEDELLRSFAALPNVEVRLFNPLPVRGGSMLGRVFFSLADFNRINRRMHNKLFIADNRFAVSGGRNMADPYFMRSRYANFIDLDVVSAGPVVGEFSNVFDTFWNSPHTYSIESVVPATLSHDAALRRVDELVTSASPDIAIDGDDPLEQATVESELSSGRLTLHIAEGRVLADSPTKIDGRGGEIDENLGRVARESLDAMRAAQSKLSIASPYFIPGPVGMADLTRVIGRHVFVVVITNSLGATDEPLVHFRYARYRRAMLELGVVIREISPDLSRESGNFGDFGKSLVRLHAKVVVIDERRLLVGSLNLDPRSVWTNTESALLIDSKALAGQVDALVARDRGESSYLLRLAPDGETIEWITTNADGKQQVHTHEPHSDWWLRLKTLLLEPFAEESLL